MRFERLLVFVLLSACFDSSLKASIIQIDDLSENAALTIDGGTVTRNPVNPTLIIDGRTITSNGPVDPNNPEGPSVSALVRLRMPDGTEFLQFTFTSTRPDNATHSLFTQL